MIRRRGRIGRMDRDWTSERLNVIPFEKLRLKIRGIKAWIFENFDGRAARNGRRDCDCVSIESKNGN